MSGLFGGAKRPTTHATRAMGVDFQGAQYGPVIPVVYGQNRVPGNCIWYGDFASQAHQQKAGKGGGGGSTSNYTYSASAQMALCEGPNISLVTVWDGNSVVNLSSINYAFASGAQGQAPWSHLSGAAALGYSYTAIFSFQNMQLGGSASLPNYNYEVQGLKPHGGGIVDANPADILTDITSDPVHGVNFPWLGSLAQYSAYCVANGLFLSPVYNQQQTANQALSDLFKYTNTYVYYSEDQLKVVPLGDVAVTGNGVTYSPNVTPVVNLGTNDFITDGSGPSITVDRKAPQDNLNLVRVEFKDRANTYHDGAVVASIDEDVIANGGRSDDSETVNGCTTAAVARFISQNLVQRAFYIRNTYTFKLSWRYCYLEPTDIVTLTDASIGLTEYPVRITDVEEGADSSITITAEEFPEGIGHSALYNTQPNGGTNIDPSADPGAVNAPYLFRGPGFLVGNGNPEIWCAVNGSAPLWGGCEVYLSHDGSSYTYAGTVASQARYGQLTTALPAGSADPDTTNTPTVEVYAPAQLLGGSQTDADNFVTMAMIDTEVIGYETATLTAASTYELGYLRRGGYSSGNVAHAIGAPFVRLDDSIFRIPVDPSLIGQTVYLKFLSMNVFGRTPRTLAEETAYTYVVGTNVELPDVPAVPSNFATQGVADGVSITWSNANPSAVGCTSIERATASAGPWSVLAQVGPTTTLLTDHFTTGATYYYRARARGPLPQSGWSAYTATFNSAGTNVSAIAVTANNAQSTANQANTTAQNLNIVNLSMAQGMLGWTCAPTSEAANWYGETGANGPNGGTSTYIVHRVSGTTSTLDNTLMPCYSGQVIKASGQCRGVGTPNGSAAMFIAFYDINKSLIGSPTNSNVVSGNGQFQLYVVATAPANAAFVTIGPSGGYAPSSPAGYYTFANFAWNYQPNSLDEVPNGTSGARNAVSSIDANNRALVDFSQGGHLNKNLDNLADGANFARVRAAQLQNGIVALLSSGRNCIFNPTFTQNLTGSANGNSVTSGAVIDGWTLSGGSALSVGIPYNGSIRVRSYGGFAIAANGATYSASIQSNLFAVTASAPFAFMTNRSNNLSTALPAGVTAFHRVYIDFRDNANNHVAFSTLYDIALASANGTTYYSGTVPAGASQAFVMMYTYFTNSGAATTLPAGSYYDSILNAVEYVQATNLDNDTVDGTTYQRMPIANMDTNRRGLVDFSQGGHLNKNLDNLADSATRFAAVQAGADKTSSNTSALTASLSNQTQDNLVDGSIYLRMPGANMDANRRGLVDFSQGGHLGKNVDNIADGTTYGRPYLTRLNAGRPVIDFSEAIHSNKNLDNVADTGNFRRVSANYIDSSNRPVSHYLPDTRANNQLPSWYFTNYPNQTLVEFKQASAIGLSGFTSATYVTLKTVVPWQDSSGGSVTQTAEMSDRMWVRRGSADATSWGAWSDASNMTIPGSGVRVGDQRNLPQRTITNYPSKVAPTVSYSASAGTPATATISTAAFTALLGSVSVGYNAASVSVTGTNGTNVNYYLYFNDPTYSGGTQTLVATTNQNDLYSGDGYVYVGYVTVAFPASGSGSGTGAGCPLRTAWVIRRGRHGRPQHVRAGNVRVGDWLLRTDGEWAEVTFSRPELQPCVRLVADGFGTLGCSISAPMQLRDGSALSIDCLAREVVVRRGSERGYAIVTDLRDLGVQWVQHITLGNAPDDFFWTGDAKGALFGHHNAKPP